MIRINIAKDYSETPGGRYIEEGSFSGEDFRERILYPQFQKAIDENTRLEINFDGGYGYASCFLEEAFGGLARQLPDQNIAEVINIISNDEPSISEEILEYINTAND